MAATTHDVRQTDYRRSLLITCVLGITGAASSRANCDLSDWSSVKQATNEGYWQVVYTGTEFLAGGFKNDSSETRTSLLLGSPDGVHWESSNRVPGLGLIYGLSADGKHVAGLAETNILLESLDGRVFTTEPIPAALPLLAIGIGEGKIVALGYGEIEVKQPNGSWTSTTLNPQCFFKGVAFGGGRLIAFGYMGDVIENYGRAYLSTDGVAWQFMDRTWKATLTAGAYGLGTFVLAGGLPGDEAIATRPYFYVSKDLTNWQQTSIELGADVMDLKFISGTFFCQFANGWVGISVDGLHWKISRGLPPNARSIAFGANRVLVTAFDNIRASEDLLPPCLQILDQPPRLLLRGSPGHSYHIWQSSDLMTWNPWEQLVAPSLFTERAVDTAHSPLRFFGASAETAP